jgi:hypothetical protein
MATSLALLRRDTLSAAAVAIFVFLALAMTGGTAPREWWQYLLTRYYFFPLNQFAGNDFHFGADALWTMNNLVVACAITVVPALAIGYMHFTNRDITE